MMSRTARHGLRAAVARTPLARSYSRALRFDPKDKNSSLQFPGQTVHMGSDSLKNVVEELRNKGLTRPLLVSDTGLAKLGKVQELAEALRAGGLTVSIYDRTTPNPSLGDVVGIAAGFLANHCDSCVGLGGGGPLDAAKGGLALVAQQRAKAGFDVQRDGAKFLQDELRPMLRAGPSKDYLAAVPDLSAIPTTAGTGSEGGKSAVITDTSGAKIIFGHPAFLPLRVALIPQLTVGLPPLLTAATGIDALFHCMEAYFVSHANGIADGMNEQEISFSNRHALEGIELVLANLPTVFTTGTDLSARLNMQAASLWGAKAFRKGDLGSVHATAHAVGAVYHSHHGTCIAKMAVPVLAYDEPRLTTDEQHEQFRHVLALFHKYGYKSALLSEAVKSFLLPFGIRLGIADLVKDASVELPRLTELATKDGCQTNPVRLGEKDYRAIFEAAARM